MLKTNYIVVQRKANKKWYVIGHTGYKNKHMPVSNAMNTKKEAEKWASCQNGIDLLARGL